MPAPAEMISAGKTLAQAGPAAASSRPSSGTGSGVKVGQRELTSPTRMA